MRDGIVKGGILKDLSSKYIFYESEGDLGAQKPVRKEIKSCWNKIKKNTFNLIN